MASLPLFHARSEVPHGLVYQAGFLDEAAERALLSGIATLDLVEAEYKHSIPSTPALRYSITLRTLAAVQPGRGAR